MTTIASTTFKGVALFRSQLVHTARDEKAGEETGNEAAIVIAILDNTSTACGQDSQ